MATDENPYASPDQAPPATKPAPVRQPLFGPALGLLVTSVLHVFGWLSFTIYAYTITSHPAANPDISHRLKTYVLYYGLTMLYSLVLISGAFSMLRRGSYLWAMATCVLALVPILGPCYFFAIPFGIWGILVLRRPEVRESFAGM